MTYTTNMCNHDETVFGPCTYSPTTNSTLTEDSTLVNVVGVLLCLCILTSCFCTLYGRGLFDKFKRRRRRFEGYHDIL